MFDEQIEHDGSWAYGAREHQVKITRRGALLSTFGGIALTFSPLRLVTGRRNANAASVDPPPDWQAGAGRARYRIDGLEKVTGKKIYARDFHAPDLDGWPDEEDLVLVLRSPLANRQFLGLDLGDLSRNLWPNSVIMASDLAEDHVGIADVDYPAGHYLLPEGQIPDYLGQAVALLYYRDFLTLDRARRAIRSQVHQGLRFGEEMPPPAESWFEPETSIIQQQLPGTKRVFSQITGGPVRPQEGKTDRDREAMEWVDKIRESMDSPEDHGWAVQKGTYETQVIDPMFMEPESGLGWLDRDDGTLHLLIGTQSPAYDARAALAMFADPLCKLGVKAVNFIAAYPGGGFGGRDTSILCLFLALAAAYGQRPVRIAYDRFEQFQLGIKRHASRCDVALAADKDGKFQAIRNYIYLNGGGRRNMSGYVAQVAGLAGTGPYSYPLVDIWSRAQKTRAVTAGSMRGFGSLQSQFAVETIIDELADTIGTDPIQLRRANVLAAGQRIDTGAPVAPPGLAEMCDRAASHRLWQDRDKRRVAAVSTPFAYGVGFALGMKNFGTGANAVLDEVAIDPEGKITVTTNVIDMGTGTATTLAIATAGRLGANAARLNTGFLAPFKALRLEESFEMQAGNPRWTPIIYESTKAASTSSKWVHGVEQASGVLFATGLLPAARDLWAVTPDDLTEDDVQWVDGSLVADGREPIPLARLARLAHDKGYVVSAMIHAFYSGRWIEADYTIAGETFRWPIDALSILRGGRTGRELIDRKKPKLFTIESIWEGNGQQYGVAGCLAAVEVDRSTGEVRIDEAIHYIGPGKVLQEDLMRGQMEGSFAMGVGQALLENLPAFEGGAGDGLWNLNRYHVPLSGDVALGRVETVVLPPESDDAPARGIAELGMVAVPPAISNAVSHATGVRFRNLPITPKRVRAAWRG
ncbi:MAG: molybdopterin cofactor-binding domain-containing protein [Pseudomonadota bacterium]